MGPQKQCSPVSTLSKSFNMNQRYPNSEKDAVHRSEVAVKGALTGEGSTSLRPMCHSFL